MVINHIYLDDEIDEKDQFLFLLNHLVKELFKITVKVHFMSKEIEQLKEEKRSE